MSIIRLRNLPLLGVAVFLVVFSVATAKASSANISRSYKINGDVAGGMLVSLDGTTAATVVPATTANSDRLLGVSVAAKDSLLAVDETKGNAQVATSGSAEALVSTLNGNIDVGDKIAVSPFDGIGVKAGPGSKIIGIAQSAFSDNSSSATKREVTNKSGAHTRISLGYVNVSIALGINKAGSTDDSRLTSLQRVGKSLTGHVVSGTRVFISLLIALVTVIALITLIYASIYGGIISVGRNPLAKHVVFRTLSVVFAMVLAVAVVAGITITLLLK